MKGRSRLRCLAVLGIVVALGGVGPGTQAETGQERGAQRWSGERLPGRFVVELAPGVDPRREGPRVASEHGGRAGMIYTDALRGMLFFGSEERASELERDPRVRVVEPDRPVRIADHENRSWLTFQRRLKAQWAYHDGHDGLGARVAVFDTGVANHPAIPRIDRRRGIGCVGSGTGDSNGHGTASAGNVISVAPRATIVPIRVLDSGGGGSFSALICGADHVTRLNSNTSFRDDIDVANMSLEAGGTCSGASSLCRAISKAVASGTVFTAAAGNGSVNAGGVLPASHPEVLAVSALQGSRQLAGFSNFGATVELIAPGVDIRSPVPGGFQLRTGTSRSAPLAGGVVAVVKALQPTMRASDVSRIVKLGGRCPDNTFNRRNGPCVGSGAWSGDPDGTTEPLPDTRRAGRLAGQLPTLDPFLPGPRAVLSGKIRVVIFGADETPTAQDTTATMSVSWRMRSKHGDSGWHPLPNDGSGRFAQWFNTNSLGNGWYHFRAVAVDADGNRTPTRYRVRIAN